MNTIQGIFNNREIAIGLWVIVALGLFLCTKAAREFLKTGTFFNLDTLKSLLLPLHVCVILNNML